MGTYSATITKIRVRKCPFCGHIMHINDKVSCNIRLLPIGKISTVQKLIQFSITVLIAEIHARIFYRYHMITNQFYKYTEELLETKLTLKEVAMITGLSQPVVKAIDKRR